MSLCSHVTFAFCSATHRERSTSLPRARRLRSRRLAAAEKHAPMSRERITVSCHTFMSEKDAHLLVLEEDAQEIKARFTLACQRLSTHPTSIKRGGRGRTWWIAPGATSRARDAEGRIRGLPTRE
eukprot:3094895-Rhodomonas_salina.1